MALRAWTSWLLLLNTPLRTRTEIKPASLGKNKHIVPVHIQSVQSSESLTIFRRRLNTELFSRSFPD